MDSRTCALTCPEEFGLGCAELSAVTGCCEASAGAEDAEGEAVAHDGSGGGAMDPRRLSGVELSGSFSFAFGLFPSDAMGARASSGAVSSERGCGEGGAGESASSSKSL